MRRKFGNKIVTIEGIKFHSKKEGNRYVYLKSLLQQKKIFDLELQPEFPFPMGFSYFADFKYTDLTGKIIIEDPKGFQTDVFKLKKKCFEYFYPQLELRIL